MRCARREAHACKCSTWCASRADAADAAARAALDLYEAIVAGGLGARLRPSDRAVLHGVEAAAARALRAALADYAQHEEPADE